jgi:hypothetical protein
MNPVTLENLIDLAEGHARNTLIKLGEKSLVPCWVLLTPENRINIVGTPWKDEGDKKIAQQKIKALIKEHEITAYSFVCEAWYAVVSKEEWSRKTLPELERPANRVDRIEIVFAAAVDKKRALMRSWRIMRDWKGAIESLQPMPEGEAASPGGWIMEMFGK